MCSILFLPQVPPRGWYFETNVTGESEVQREKMTCLSLEVRQEGIAFKFTSVYHNQPWKCPLKIHQAHWGLQDQGDISICSFNKYLTMCRGFQALHLSTYLSHEEQRNHWGKGRDTGITRLLSLLLGNQMQSTLSELSE